MKIEFCQNIFEKFSNIRFYKKKTVQLQPKFPIWMDRNDETNSRLLTRQITITMQLQLQLSCVRMIWGELKGQTHDSRQKNNRLAITWNSSTTSLGLSKCDSRISVFDNKRVLHERVCAHTQTSTVLLIPHTKTASNHRFGQLPLHYTYFCARIIPTLPHPTSFHFLPCTVVSRLVIGAPTAHVSDVIYHVKDMRSASLSKKQAIGTSQA
jgi:hypothetical protein